MTAAPPKAVIHLRDVRRRAIKRVLIGAIVAATWIAVVLLVVGRNGVIVWGPGLGVPGVLLLMGLAELATGRSFHELAQRWDELKPWQRAVFGIIIVAIALAVIIALASLVIMALVG